MWILTFLTDWIVHAILAIGIIGVIASFVLSFVPIVKNYIIPARIVSIVILCLALFLEGGVANRKEWELKTAELKVKLAEAEAKAATENVKIVEKVVKKTEYIKLRGNDIIVEIDKIRTVLDTNCTIPPEFVTIHNKAAEAVK